jgi:hypothetical protein
MIGRMPSQSRRWDEIALAGAAFAIFASLLAANLIAG